MEIDKAEAQQLVHETMSGNWIPFTLVVGLLGVIVVLTFVILKIKENHMNERNNRQDDNIVKLTNLTAQMATMLAVHEAEIKTLKSA